MNHIEVQSFMLEDDGTFPNNPTLPVVVYPQAIAGREDPVTFCRQRLQENGWGGTWVNGVFGHHHYHSNAHEFLGFVSGHATLALGGPNGVQVEVSAGDVAILPAGTAHRRLDSSSDFRVVGAYPGGMAYDMNTGEPGEREAACERITRVPVPDADPLFGEEGPLRQLWSR
jgi:uncharacterized protein YjlB